MASPSAWETPATGIVTGSPSPPTEKGGIAPGWLSSMTIPAAPPAWALRALSRKAQAPRRTSTVLPV
jgi:hypothetical protein